MKRWIKKVAMGVFLCCGLVVVSASDGEAAAKTPKLNRQSVTLVVSVANGSNTYGKETLKIKYKKSFVIKSVKYKSKNIRVAKVSKSGKITAQSPGKTKVVVTVKYRNKSNKKIKKKTTKVSITVKSKYLLDIPRTGMKYDESGKALPIYPFTTQIEKKGVYSNEASYIDRFKVYVETDYDTDQDGKRDMVMAYVQVPESRNDMRGNLPLKNKKNS